MALASLLLLVVRLLLRLRVCTAAGSSSCVAEDGTCPVDFEEAPFRTTPLGPALGAEVVGLDLGKPMSTDTFKQLDDLMGEYLVLCFRGQHSLTPQQQIDFTKRWGLVEPHPLGSRIDSHPEGMPMEVMVAQNTMEVDNNTRKKSGTVRNDVWHSDLSCMERPVSLSVLHAVAVPPPGWGDTMFANMQAAWQTLSSDLRQKVAWLDAVHNTAHFESKGRKEKFTKSASNLHPVVRTHPKTKRNALYLSANFINHFDNMTREESLPLLDQLVKHATMPENVYRHRWKPGDVVVWDNRATMHYAVFDYEPGQRRTLHRTTASGERPFRKLEDSELATDQS